MSAWLGIACQFVPLVRLIANSLGYHFADPILDALSQVCAGAAGGAGAVVLAKSDKFVD